MAGAYNQARYWRCALQVNPVGYGAAYRGADHGLKETEYNEALLKKCLELDIKVIGLADHGSVECVDALRNHLAPNGILVFPGFEISSTEKIHMVCLFAEDTTKEMLFRYLGHLGLTNPEETVWPSSFSCLEIARKVAEVGGFWFAAHMTGNNGLLHLHKDGGGLTHVWKDHCLVRAGQIPGPIADLPASSKQIVENNDPAWKREKPIAIINAKDVAKPEDLDAPGASCLIKMTKPNFDAFKVAFLDPESRIRLNTAQETNPAGKINRMAITGGYLDGLKVDFSPHLNTVIGGRGTGKSTLIEFLRYALDIPPKGKQAKKLHDEIVKENLGKFSGQVAVEIFSAVQLGKTYRVSRRFGENPIVRDAAGTVSTMQPRDLVPALDIYGQNEIYELSQDEQNRLTLLNRFLPGDGAYALKSDALHKLLSENQTKLAKLIDDTEDLRAKADKLPKLQEQLLGYQSLGIEEILSTMPLFERERAINNQVGEAVAALEVALSDFSDTLPDLNFIGEEALAGLPNVEMLRGMGELLNSLNASYGLHIGTMKDELAGKQQAIHKLAEEWKLIAEQSTAEIEKSLRQLPATSGKTGQEIGTAYSRLLAEIEQIKPMKNKLETLTGQRKELEQARRNLLAQLSDLRNERTAELLLATKKLNKRLDKKLKVEIIPEADRGPLKRFLIDCHLEGVAEKRLAWIDESETVRPSTLAKSIRDGAGALQLDWKLSQGVAESLAKLPHSRLMELEALELSDRVDIYLNVSHGEAEPMFKPLDKLSTGQQCTAILHLLLLDNQDPLVMDQPEDNLDNAFIADRIVRALREAKTNRQFLFATHNANIPVFGDAEWIGVFTSTDNQGQLGADAQGSIDVPAIRDQVANILEGGKEAFIQRKEKYEF